MSKKIESARKELTDAIKKHAAVVGARGVTQKKAQRAAARVQAAVTAYTAAVEKKTGISTPITWDSGLQASTLASLNAERAALVEKTREES